MICIKKPEEVRKMSSLVPNLVSQDYSLIRFMQNTYTGIWMDQTYLISYYRLREAMGGFHVERWGRKPREGR